MQISAAPKAGKGPGGTFPLLKEGTNYAKKKTVSGLFCPAGHHPFYYFFYLFRFWLGSGIPLPIGISGERILSGWKIISVYLKIQI